MTTGVDFSIPEFDLSQFGDQGQSQDFLVDAAGPVEEFDSKLVPIAPVPDPFPLQTLAEPMAEQPLPKRGPKVIVSNPNYVYPEDQAYAGGMQLAGAPTMRVRRPLGQDMVPSPPKPTVVPLLLAAAGAAAGGGLAYSKKRNAKDTAKGAGAGFLLTGAAINGYRFATTTPNSPDRTKHAVVGILTAGLGGWLLWGLLDDKKEEK